MGNAVDALAARIGELAGHEVTLERPSDPSHGDYATNVALQLAGTRKQGPRDIAAELAEGVAVLEGVVSAEVAGPGFVNIRVTDAFLESALAEIDDRYGGGFADPAERIQVEMVSANPTGPITVAAARNGAYGDSVARLLEFGGNTVEREYYYNDSGTQMDRFRASVEAARRGEDPPEDGYKGAYVVELAKEPGDPVPRMLEGIEASLERFRIHFDSWAKQSELEGAIPALLERVPTYESDGAIFVRSTDFGDDKDRVLIRSAERGGTPTYEAADIAYLENKLDRGFDRAIYVLGADHHGVAGWFAVIAQMLGYDPARIEVILYQFVHLIRSGEQVKMGKRAGNVVFLDDFIDEIGVDAARWYLVNRGPDQSIELDLDIAADKSAKNPVYYVQYAHARIAGLIRNAGDAEVGGPAPPTLEPLERELIKRLAEFPEIVRDAAAKRGPQVIPVYAIKVADDFHRFYHDVRVIGEDAQAFRLGLCLATQRVIARCLDLVGVAAPDSM